MWESIIVILIVAVATVAAGRFLYRSLKGRGHCADCGKTDECKFAGPTGEGQP